jgi:hypothetical protein
MPTPNHAAAYEDLYKLFELALADAKGIRVRFSTNGRAIHARLRMNAARQINRADNAILFPEPTNPMHGKSAYDALIFKVDDCYVVIERVDGTVYEVESLSERLQPEPKPDRRF